MSPATFNATPLEMGIVRSEVITVALPAFEMKTAPRLQSGSRLQIDGADGGTRTRTDLSVQRILSPLRLPFRHIGARPDLQ
jgi:hypothetical protein